MSKFLGALTFVFATITFSSLAHASTDSIGSMKLVYSCAAQDGARVTLTIPNASQVVLEEANTNQTASLVLSNEVQTPSGYKGFEGYLPCAPAKPGFMTCHSIQLLQLALSPEIQRASLEGAVILNGERFSCQVNMM